MPRILLPIFGLEAGINNNVLISIVRDIYTLLGFRKDIYTLYGEDNINLITEKNQNGELTNVNTIPSEYINIGSADEMFVESPPQRIGKRPTNKPLFDDSEIGTVLIPVYTNRKLTISFTYYSRSKSKVSSIASMINTMTNNTGIYRQHDIDYSYQLPQFVIDLLKWSYDVKKKAGYAGCYEDYVLGNSDIRLMENYFGNGDLNMATYAVREKLIAVNGRITDDTLNLNYVKADNRYNIEINYEIVYSKTVQMYLEYGLLVYNTPLPSKFVNVISDTVKKMTRFQFGVADGIVFNNAITTNNIGRTFSCLTIPENDIPQRVQDKPGYKPLATVLLMVTGDRILANLVDINELVFSEPLLDFLRGEGYNIGKIRESFFLLTLKKDNTEMYENHLQIDENLNIISSLELDLKSTYRLVIYMAVDTRYIKQDPFNRLQNYIRAYYNEHGIDVEIVNMLRFMLAVLGVNVKLPIQFDMSSLDFDMYVQKLFMLIGGGKTVQVTETEIIHY